MTDRDTRARLTPYELGIPGRGFAREYFPAILEEAESRESDLSDPGAFILLGQVGRAIREIQGEERGEEALHRYGAFLFQAFHFHAAREPLLLVETPVVRHLVESDPAFPEWSGGLPFAAGYLQLPRHLFWSDAGEGETAEPVDGVFWTRSVGETLSLLIATGVRQDRPGLSLTELPPVPLGEAGGWPALDARESGRDFETTLPGGELDRLYSLVNLAEVLKLVSRIFAYIETVPHALGDPEPPPPPEAEGETAAEGAGPASDVGAAAPRPSSLPFRRVRLAT